jgi:hypothetical protein
MRWTHTTTRNSESWLISFSPVEPDIIAYLNWRSDLLRLFARKIEVEAGANDSLRDMNAKTGPRWSKAW